jgi:hypothetical protein
MGAESMMPRSPCWPRSMCAEPSSLVDGTPVKALARAHRWRGMLDSGEYGSIEVLAQAEKINPSYLARVLRLTLLVPDIVESILDGRHDPERITLARLMRPSPAVWGPQEHAFSHQPSRSIV